MSDTKHPMQPIEMVGGEVSCSCSKCNSSTSGLFIPVQMIVCPKCGNKRCPHASDHNYECTGSNEPGQEGSFYERH